MGKVKWGVIAAIAAVIAVVLLATQGVFTTGRESSDTAGSSKTSAEEEAGQDAATPTVDGERVDSSERTADAGADDSPAPTDGADASDTSSAAGAGGTPDEELQQEAEAFVEKLAEPSDEPVPLEDAEAFVGADRPLASVEPGSGAPGAGPSDAGDLAGAGAATSALAGDAAPDVGSAPETAGRDASSGTRTAEEAAGDGSSLQASTTAAESEASPGTDARGTGTEDAPQANVDLPLSEETPVTIAELLGAEETIPSNAVFYVHTVQSDDVQGIWGIVHDGIVGNFATGVAVHRGESTETYRVDIPRNADERKADASSSFLGRLIYDKTQRTYVYNYRTERLGKNPDLIIPGQEIVIVSFTPEELIEIYKHFARGS